MVSFKCEHKNDKYKCRVCSPSYFCQHDKYKYTCKVCNPKYNNKKKKTRTKCEHDKRKDSCVKCSGCIHQKLICISCSPHKFCVHKRKKNLCKECREGSLCEHNEIKFYCRTCSPKKKCEHNKRKSSCVDCKGKSICEHSKLKWNCILCDGKQICEHKKLKKNCKECNGSDFCEHKKQKYTCKSCNGKGICEHNIRKLDCKICKPENYLISLLRKRTRDCLKKLGKKDNTIDYLGCTQAEFYKYISSKMTNIMTLDNIHIDHIKPVSKFNFSNIDEVYECCHWSNLQPLLATDNLKKSNKWTEQDEINWRNNIIKYKKRMSIDNT